MGWWFSKTPKDKDGGTDNIGQNPTGLPRKSSAGKRRQKDAKTFGGTKWDKKKKGK